MMRRAKGTLLAAVLIGFFILTSVSPARDVVEFEVEEGQKTQLVGQITREGWRAVRIEFQRNGETKTAEIPREKIVKIRHGNKPQTYNRAMRQYDNRDYGEAYRTFRKIAQDPPSGEEQSWVKPYALFHAGRSAFRRALTAKTGAEKRKKYYSQAAEQFSKLRGQFSEHRFAPRASLKLARARVESGQLSGVSALLEEIANSEYPERVKQSARVVKGRLLMARDNLQKAVDILEEVRKSAGQKRPSVQHRAMMAQADAHGALDQPGQAESLWWKVAVRAESDRLRAKACVKRGLSLKKRGRLREALYSFLRVVVLHTDQVDAHKKALYHSALAAREYYEGSKRAEELASDLYTRYPQSALAKRLRKEMKAGGRSGS